jgi:hypothetical protein
MLPQSSPPSFSRSGPQQTSAGNLSALADVAARPPCPSRASLRPPGMLASRVAQDALATASRNPWAATPAKSAHRSYHRDRGDMDTRTNAKTTDHSLDYVGTFGAGCSMDLRQLAMNCQPVTQSWATATLAATIAACTLPIGSLAPNRRAFVLFGRGNSLSRVNYAEQLYQACRVTLARASPAHSSDEYQLTHAISLRSCKRR